MSFLRRTGLALGVLALAVTLVACGGDDDPGKGPSGDPATVLAAAKEKFDAAKSVHFTMRTDSKPTEGDGVLGADGTLTHQPAFEGTVKAHISGIDAEVPIVAVGGKVYAKLPLTTGYSPIDPAEYGAPDPAAFADPAVGISGLLNQLDDLAEGDRKRDGKLVLTTYTGTLAGELVAPIIPSADAEGTYETVIGIDDDGRIATLSVTGAFFTGNDDVTYDLAFDDYDEDVTISKP